MDNNRHIYGWWRVSAEKKEYRKYYRALERGMAGIVGDGEREYSIRDFKRYELTTKKGDDNTYARIRNDHKRLVKEMKRKGFNIEYYACAEYSPDNNLIHIHGVMRGEVKPEHKLLSELWERIHGAKIVFIRYPYNKKETVNYLIKHMIKEYPETDKMGIRVMCSRGWVPSDYNIVSNIIKRVSLELINSGKESKVIWGWYRVNIKKWLKGELTDMMVLGQMKRYFRIFGEYMYFVGGDYYKLKDFYFKEGLLYKKGE